MAFLFLPCTRHCAWMEFFNISYANGVKYHRWLGMLAIYGAILHAIPFYWLWYRQGVQAKQALPCFDCQLDYWHIGYPKWFNVFGEISLIFMLAILFTSHPWVRRHFLLRAPHVHPRRDLRSAALQRDRVVDAADSRTLPVKSSHFTLKLALSSPSAGVHSTAGRSCQSCAGSVS